MPTVRSRSHSRPRQGEFAWQIANDGSGWSSWRMPIAGAGERCAGRGEYPAVPADRRYTEGISAERRHDAGRWLGLTEGAHGSIAPEAMTIRSLRAAALVLALGSPAGEFGRRVGTNQATRPGATSSMGSRPLAVRIPTGLRAQK